MFTITNPKTHKGLIALFLMALLFSFEAAAQNEVAIGSATTKSNAILWLNGNGSQGLILPVVTNKSAVSNPDKGMVVYDDSDNKVWYRSNSAWVEVGSGTGATTTNLNLLLQGNQLQLRDGTTVQSTVNIAAGTQTNGAFLVFTGGSWQYATLSGDVTGANGALQVNGIKGKTIATLPATTQALVYDPTANAGAGGWSFQALTTGTTVPTLNNGQLLTGNGTTNSATTITGDATLSGGALTIGNNAITTAKINAAAVDNTKLADNAVTTAKISDATITGADIAASTITADKLAQSAATSGQVLKWNGTNWVPQNETTSAATILSNGQILTGNGTTNAATTLSGDATLSGGAVTIANNAINTAKISANAVDATKLADNAVTTVKISDGTITGADIAATTITGANIAATTITADKLAQSTATSGQVLKWNGTNWVPAADDAGVGATPTLSSGQILTGNGTSNSATALTGDATLAGGVITIGNNAITTAKINAAAVDATKLADNSVTTLKVADNAITTTKISTAAVDATKLADNAVTTLKVADNAITTTKISDGSITNLKVANDAITSANITNATITGADIAATTITGANIAATTITADKLAQSTATSGQVLKWNGTNWVPAADDAGVGATPTLSSGQILTGNGTTNSATALTGDATLAGAVITIGNNAITTAKINTAAVDATKLADGSVTTLKVADNSITTTKISDGSITNLKVANDAITSAKITNATITGADIAATTVTGSNIAAATIAGSNIANTTITGANIAATTITADKLAASSAISGQVLKWNGTNWVPAADDAGVGATPTLSSGQILTGNGTTNTATALTGDATLAGGVITIGNNAITTAKINTAAVDATKLADNSVTTLKVADNAITTSKINAAAVDASKLADNSVTTLKVADNAITTTKISDGSITNLKVANDAITSANITNATITGADIAATTITADKLAQSTATSGQVLKWNGTNWVPAADDAGAGATPTLSSGQILIGDGTTNSAAALSGDATLTGGVITISSNAINSAKIADATITGSDIAATTITDANINAAANIAATKLASTVVLDTETPNVAGDINGDFSTGLQIKANTITAAEITDASITGADLATNIAISTTGNVSVNAPGIIGGIGSGLTTLNASNISLGSLALARITPGTNGQVLTTTAGVPAWQTPVTGATTLDGLTDATVTAASSGQLLVNDGAGQFRNVGMSGDASITNAGLLILTNSAGTRTNLGLGALATLGTVTTTEITDGTIANIDINAAAAIAGTKIAPAFGAQAISTTGTLSSGAATVTGLIVTGTGTTLNTVGYTWPGAQGGAGTVLTNNGAGTLTWTSATAGWSLGGNAASGPDYLGTNNGQDLDIRTNATNRMTIRASNGNVGINNSSPIEILDVSGNVRFSGALMPAGIAGSAGQVLTSAGIGVAPTWTAAGMSNPLTTTGDIIYATGTTPTRLAGAAGVLKSTGAAAPTWGAVNLASADVTGILPIANGGTNATTAAAARTNLGLGALATLATVTTTEITDGTIANIDINAAAAIAGTKITPAFGAQPISTTGTLFSGAATVTALTVSGTTTTLNTVGYTWPAVQGGAGTILTNSGTGALTWTAAGMTNPLTTNGDIIYGVGSTPTRLAAGTGFLKGGAVPSYAAVNLASADVSGILPITNGGTGAITAPTALSNLGGLSNTLTNGNIFVGSAGNIATPVAMGGDATISNTGVLTIAAGAVNLTTDVTGTLPSSRGGTGLTSVVLGGVAYGGATDFGFTAAGTSGQLLQSNGTAAPTWVNAPTSGWSLTGNAGTNPATNFIGTTDAQPLRLNTGVGGIERMRIDATGNVGIGSIAPTHKLEIAGGGNVLGFDNNAQLRSKNGSGVYETWLFPRDGNTMYLNYGSDGFHIRDNSSITRMFMDNTGKVGVGTIAPSTDMQIDASTPTLRLRSTQSNTLSQSYIEFGHDDGSGGYVSAGSIGDTGAGDFMQIFSPNAIIFNSNFAFRFSIGTNGELGVGGTLDPGTAGQVLTSGGSGAAPSWTAASSGWGLSGNAGTDATNFIGTTDAQPLRFATGVGGTERMRIDAAGDVGIGTNNPRSKLEIQSGDLVLSGNATTPLDPPDINFVTQTNVNKAKIWTSQTTNTLWISTSLTPTGVGQRHLTLDPNGNFGFSNESPTEKVDIGGNVKFSGALMPNNSAGASGQVLASAGAGLPPIWTNPSGTTLINNTGTRNLFAGSPIGTTTTGTDNAFYGSGAGDVNTTGNWNVFVGTSAATNHSTGDLNTIIGWNAGQLGTGHQGNTLIGAQAGQNTTGITNTFIGEKSGQANTSGIESVFVGNSAGLANTTGSRNTILGYFANVGAAGLQNASAIGHRASVNQSNSLVLGSINGVNGATASTSVGIGTTTPSARLDISGNTLIRGTNTNAAPTVSSGLELMVGRSNFGTLIAGQTSADIALNWGGASGGFRHFIQTRHNSVANSNSNSIDFFVNNSTTAAGSIAPNNTTPNGNVLAMSMTAAGIGIGTAAPNANTKVHISGAGTQYLRVEGTGAGATGGIEFDGTGTAADWRIVPQLGILTFNLGDVNGTINRMYQMNAGYFIPDNTGNPNPTLGQSTARWGTIFTTIAVNVSSDRRLKNNIHNLNYGLKEILELRPVSYSLRSDKTRNTYLGLIAQEVQELIPEIVSTGDDAEKTLGMRYAELVPVLIKAIQEQQAIIETLKSENAASNEKTEKLNKEIEAIKARLGMTAKVEK